MGRRVAAVLALGVSLALGPGVIGQDAVERPRLLVILVIDQMRADYVTDYGPQWRGGLRRLVDHGAVFSRAAYPYHQTATCPGHATISTGTLPSTHGLALNWWWDRGTRRLIACIDDPDTPLVSYGSRPLQGGASAARLRTSSLSEELRARFGDTSQSAVMALKDRSAIALAGRGADVVTWLHEASGWWATSTAYSAQPVPFVHAYVRAHPIDAEVAKSWRPLLPAGRYRHEDAAPGARPPEGWTSTFPHSLQNNRRRWMGSPFSDAFLAGLAVESVDALKMGADAVPDLLAVSFSALDLVGHRFGPRSHEVQDVLLRLDGAIGQILDHLDRQVGAGGYVVALTSDHGVGAIPEPLRAGGEDAGRIPTEQMRQRIEQALGQHLGPGPHLAHVQGGDVYFTPGVIERIEGSAALRRSMIKAVADIPGIAQAFLASDLSGQGENHERDAVALSYVAGRSGDLIAVPRPNWSFVDPDTLATPAMAATHGTLYPYDTRVPLVLMGTRIKRGAYSAAVSPADIAPTLAVLAGFTMSGRDGRVLSEAIDK